MVKFLPYNALLESTTDLKGYITSMNLDFEDACEFENIYVVGMNHNIIRSCDMPTWVFKEMWDTIVVGKLWSGIIKNQTVKGDKHYWVKACVEPDIVDGVCIGYKSHRRQATDIEIAVAMELYSIDLD